MSKRKKTATISVDQIEILVDLLKTLGDSTRLNIILLCLKRRFSVGEIADHLKLSQPLVSHHLRLLKAARLVRAEREGQHIFYTLSDQHVSGVLQDLIAHINEVS
jgi:DNA-binding transcriptional ArsR family regulator